MEIVYLFRNICFGLLVEDSHDYCRHRMWIRRIETNLLTIIAEYDYEWYILHMYGIQEEKMDVLHVLRRRNGMDSIELCWPVCPRWKSRKPFVYMGVNSREWNFRKMANRSECICMMILSVGNLWDAISVDGLNAVDEYIEPKWINWDASLA